MPPTKSRWDKSLKQATFWLGSRDVLLSLDRDGSVTWDGPGSYADRISPNEGNPNHVIDWLEELSATFRDAAKAAKAMKEGK